MTPQHRDLLDKRFTQLSKSGTNVDTLGWVALHAEGSQPFAPQVPLQVRDTSRATRAPAARGCRPR
jgi:hypothetical protein